MAWKWSSENRFNPKENSKKNNPPIFKSEDAVNQLLALSEDEMIEKLFRMEMNQAVSVSNLLLVGTTGTLRAQLGSFQPIHFCNSANTQCLKIA